jgi:hypothetical protein
MRCRPHPTRNTTRLRLELLDRRDVPNAVTWTLGADGDFANAAAWTDATDGSHHVPGAGDDASIPTQFSVTSAADESVKSLAATGFQLLGGTFTISSPSTLSNFTESGGTLGGIGTVTLTGTPTWSGGSMADGGTTVVDTGATLSLTGDSATGGEMLGANRTLNVVGAIQHVGTGALDIGPGAVLEIGPNGTYTLSADANITGSGMITNEGLLVKSSTKGSGTSTVDARLVNSGTLNINTGILALTQDLTQSAGVTMVGPGATLQTGTVQLNGGLLGGSGTIDGNVSGGGAIRPGTSATVPGILTINGTLNQFGPLDIVFNGPNAGTDYSQLAVNGTVNLSGPLNFTNNFSPTSGMPFEVINNGGPGPVNGTFMDLPEGAKIKSGGQDFTITYHGGTGNDVVLTAPVNATTGMFAVGSGPGGDPLVKVYNADGSVRFSFDAYPVGFHGGVTVAMGDVDGDGTPDIITAAGPGGGPHIKVFSGVNGGLIENFFAYNAAFTGGVFVAAGDVNGDGHADIITGAGAGGGPLVKVFSGSDGTVLAGFFAYPASFTGGVRVAAGDINNDGHADIITGAGRGGGPHVKVFSGANFTPLASFFAYNPGFTGGVFVGAGDVNNDGHADIITGAGPGGAPHVKVFSGVDLTMTLFSFFAYESNFPGGVTVAAADVNGDGKADIVTGPGPSSVSEIRVFSGADNTKLREFLAFDPTFIGGVFVG